MMFRFGEAPPKRLSESARAEIAALLAKNPDELAAFFDAVDAIITDCSPEAQPLSSNRRRLSRARTELKAMRKHADALQVAIEKADQQIRLRMVLGSLQSGRNGEPPLGDFSLQLLRFRELLKKFDEALTPRRGGADRTDHLRGIVARCAIQYRQAVGENPAKRPGGVFHRMMNIILGAIGLKLPKDPYNILRSGIEQVSKSPPLRNKHRRKSR
jgi:hypothetical protein